MRKFKSSTNQVNYWRAWKTSLPERETRKQLGGKKLGYFSTLNLTLLISSGNSDIDQNFTKTIETKRKKDDKL